MNNEPPQIDWKDFGKAMLCLFVALIGIFLLGAWAETGNSLFLAPGLVMTVGGAAAVVRGRRGVL